MCAPSIGYRSRLWQSCCATTLYELVKRFHSSTTGISYSRTKGVLSIWLLQLTASRSPRL